MVDTLPQPAYHENIVSLSSSSTPQPTSPQLTLLDVKNHLYVHFLGKTTFNLRDDLGAIKLGATYDDPKGKLHAYKEVLVASALDDMVKAGLLLTLDAKEGVCMLVQPLGLSTQTVQITPYTAHIVADAFNFFAVNTGPTAYRANKLAITDTEIQSLALVVFALRDQVDDLQEQIADMMGDDDGPEDGFPPLGANTPENDLN